MISRCFNGLFLGAALFALTGCSGLRGLTLPSQYEKGGTEVEVFKSNLNFLGLSPSKDNDRLIAELASKCPSGKVKNVVTEFHGKAILILYFEEITVSGNCVE